MSSIYPPATPEIARRRRDLAPNQQAALEALGKAVFADGALPTKTKQIIAVAVAHVTQCPYCINGHTKRRALGPAAIRAASTGRTRDAPDQCCINVKKLLSIRRRPHMTDTVEKVSAKKLWNWNLKLWNPGKWNFESRLRICRWP